MSSRFAAQASTMAACRKRLPLWRNPVAPHAFTAMGRVVPHLGLRPRTPLASQHDVRRDRHPADRRDRSNSASPCLAACLPSPHSMQQLVRPVPHSVRAVRSYSLFTRIILNRRRVYSHLPQLVAGASTRHIPLTALNNIATWASSPARSSCSTDKPFPPRGGRRSAYLGVHPHPACAVPAEAASRAARLSGSAGR